MVFPILDSLCSLSNSMGWGAKHIYGQYVQDGGFLYVPLMVNQDMVTSSLTIKGCFNEARLTKSLLGSHGED